MTNTTNTTPNTPKTTGRRGRPAGSKNKETFEMMPVGLLIKVLQANAMVPVKKEFADMLLANIESQKVTHTETENVEEPQKAQDEPHVSPLNLAVQKQMQEQEEGTESAPEASDDEYDAEYQARKAQEAEEAEFAALLAEEEVALSDTNEVTAPPLGVRHAAKPSVLLMN